MASINAQRVANLKQNNKDKSAMAADGDISKEQTGKGIEIEGRGVGDEVVVALDVPPITKS